MPFELVRMQKSINATASLAGKQYFFVKLDANGQIVVAAAGNYAIGVVQDAPLAGEPGSVCGPGDITKVVCGGSFNSGGLLSVDTNGKAVAATSGAHIVGHALTGGADGKVATILFQPMGKL